MNTPTLLPAKMKPMPNPLFAAAAGALALLALPAQAATVLIDFNPGNLASAAYNVVGLTSGTTGNVALKDTSSTLTGWTLNATASAAAGTGNAGAGGNAPASRPAAIASYETNAVLDSIFINAGITLTVTISGLNDAHTYDMLFYGARTAGGGLQTWHQTVGTGGFDVTHNSAGNSTVVVDWNGMKSSGGVIAFTVGVPTGGAGPAAVNFGEIISTVPEPGSLTLLGLGGLSLLRRRRA